MSLVKVNFRHNLVKLSVLRALDLRHGQLYDARGICELTGLKHSTIHSHLKFWSDGMVDKNGRCVGLLKRVPAVSGRRLAWKYTISSFGRTWLKAVDPVLLADISKHLAKRWLEHITSYDIPGAEPLESLTSILKENKPLAQVVINKGESVDISPVINKEVSIPDNTDSAFDTDEETIPAGVIQQVKDNWYDHNQFALPEISFDELYLSPNDKPSASRSGRRSPKKTFGSSPTGMGITNTKET